MNESVITKTSEYFKKNGVVLPTISELRTPHLINEEVKHRQWFRPFAPSILRE